MKGKLSKPLFRTIVENTPLVSIDLIVENQYGQILLGQRLNKPAKDHWFIPGGRILKSEKMADAFARLAKEELNLELCLHDVELHGTYEHFYEDSFVDDNVSTHYVVLAYKVFASFDIDTLPGEQHNSYRWFDLDELIASNEVHLFTKDYFQERI